MTDTGNRRKARAPPKSGGYPSKCGGYPHGPDRYAAGNAKPGPKTVRLRDERGLYLEASPKGGKWWRLRYTFQGKGSMLSLYTLYILTKS